MKYSFIFLSLLIISACQENNQNLNISDFYYSINDYKVPKVLQYITNDDGEKSYLYTKLSKLGENVLLIEQFDNSFNKLNRIILIYTSEGVKYKEYWVRGENNIDKLVQQNIIDSLVFPRNLNNNSIQFEALGESGDFKTKFIVKNLFNEPMDTIINYKKIVILYGNGERTWRITSKKIPLLSKKMTVTDKIIYQKGFGIYSIITNKENGGIYRMDFDKELSIEEFENKKTPANRS